MIRTLVLIAAIGMFVSVVCLATAFAVGGQDLARNGWSFPDDWRFEVHDGEESGPTTTRKLDWQGGTTLSIDAPAVVRYTQAPGPAKLEITGPQDVVDRVSVSPGRIDYDGHRARGLVITMSAPNIDRFDLDNRSRLTVDGYDQDKLELDMAGRSSVQVTGRTRSISLSMSGRGDADLGQLKTQDAKVAISGAATATLAPVASADVGVSGAGQVTLLTHPPSLHTDISGAGRLTQVDTPAPEAEKKR